MREGRPKGERTRWSCPTGEGGDKGCKISPGQHVVDGSFQGIPKSCKDFLTDTAGAGVTGGSSANGLLFFFFFFGAKEKMEK